jgi:hypothetical protein
VSPRKSFILISWKECSGVSRERPSGEGWGAGCEEWEGVWCTNAKLSGTNGTESSWKFYVSFCFGVKFQILLKFFVKNQNFLEHIFLDVFRLCFRKKCTHRPAKVEKWEWVNPNTDVKLKAPTEHAGLPDLSRYNIPKWKEIYILNDHCIHKCIKSPRNVPNGNKIQQMAVTFLKWP